MWWQPWRQRLTVLPVQRSRSPAAESDRWPALPADPPDCLLHDIQKLDCDLRHSPSRPIDVGPGLKIPEFSQAIQMQERQPLLWPPVGPVLRKATPPLHCQEV